MKPIIIITSPVKMTDEQSKKLTEKMLGNNALICLFFDPKAEKTTIKVIHDESVKVTEL